MATSLKRSVCMLLLGMSCIPGASFAAEQLNDPTKPAFELVPALGEPATSEQKQAPAGLQSVILSPKREAAIINGTEVGMGEKYGDAVLTEVNETCVVLTGPEGRRVMHMFPTVSMSKTEMECRRQGMRPVSDATVGAVKKNTAGKKAKTKKRTVVCAPVEENRDGGGK